MDLLYVGPLLPEYVAAMNGLLPPGWRLDTVAKITHETLPKLQRAEVVLTLGPITREALESAPRLKLVQVLGAGCDGVDLVAAKENGVAVATTGGANARSVAEHAMALILAVYRRLAYADRALRSGCWLQADFYRGGVFELSGKTLGMVGLGHVGQELAGMAAGFGLRKLYYQRHPLPAERERALGVSYTALEELFATSDIVSLQIPLTSETKGLAGRKQLALMKKGAVLINISRGGVLDQQALIEGLAQGQIAGAGLDVFAQEPLEPDSALLQLDNVVLTPHVAGAAQESVRRTFEVSFDNFVHLAAGEPLTNVVVDAGH